jgi:hypothetical protein
VSGFVVALLLSLRSSFSDCDRVLLLPASALWVLVSCAVMHRGIAVVFSLRKCLPFSG